MNKQRQFFSMLAVMRQKLWMARTVSLFYSVLFAVACAVLVWVVCGRFVVITNMDTKIRVTCVIGGLVFVAASVWRRPSVIEAVIAFDTHGLDDRVITMFGALDDDSEVAGLQRNDTLQVMRKTLPEIQARKTHWFYWKRAVPALALFAFVCLGLLFPSDVMKKASQIEQENQLVAEKKDEVKRFVEKQKDKVKPKAQEELTKLKQDIGKAKKADDVMEHMLEAEKKLDQLKRQSSMSDKTLQRLGQSLENPHTQGLAKALQQRDPAAVKKQMEALKKKLNELDGEDKKKLLKELQQLADAAGQKGKVADNPQQSLAALQKQLAGMMASAGGLQSLASAQQKLQSLAKGMNKEMTASGLAPSGKLAFGKGNENMPTGNGSASGGKQSGKKNGNGSTNGGNGKGSGNGSGSGSGSGAGSGSGNGNGSGSGSGKGSGSGSGSGTGGTGSGSGGNGAGFGKGSHNLLTVPKTLDGKENKEVDSGELGKGKNGKQKLSPQSPVLPGQVRPYSEVYGDYQSTYRQSLERSDLPDHLQSIVKNYFSDLAPNE